MTVSSDIADTFFSGTNVKIGVGDSSSDRQGWSLFYFADEGSRDHGVSSARNLGGENQCMNFGYGSSRIEDRLTHFGITGVLSILYSFSNIFSLIICSQYLRIYFHVLSNYRNKLLKVNYFSLEYI